VNFDKGTKLHISLLVVVIVVFIWSVIKPAVFWTWAAEAGPSVVALIIIILTYKKFRLTSLSYWIIALLSILTFIGGHYTYAEVPLFNWIKDEFNLQRNHYDRFGHFLKGLSAIVVREILIRNTPLTKGNWLFAISTSIVLAIAALYEIVEWLSTKLPYAKKATEDFLGMQGDEWDAQWDMSFALIGSILALIVFSKLHNRQLKNQKDKQPNSRKR
jgi:putative membrane protein